MKKLLILTLILALLVSPPAAFAGDAYATARTPLSGTAAHTANAELAAWAVNQTALRYGETFSFNSTVGPLTPDRGFLSAANSLGEDVAGGGAEQAASTLYLALLNLNAEGVDFTQVHSCGPDFTGNYTDDGSQALMLDCDSGVDFAFTNCAADEMFIEMWSSNGYLYCSVSVSDAGERSIAADTADINMPSIPRTVAGSEILLSGGSNALINAELAANSICDTTLNSGDIFSFNAIVGPREQEYGYVSAVNGRGTQVTGGGVAQVASAVWLAVKELDDISIIEKSTYGNRYNQSYVNSSADAILTDYKAGTDFAFRYTGEGRITIYTYLNGSTLICSITKG